MVKKSAFTIIELIFAIVVIGFVVLSLPMLSSVTSKGIEANLVQEAIFAASAELNQAISYPWDENSREANSTLSKVINTGDCNGSTHMRIGHIHRVCLNDLTLLPTNTDENDNDDINDAAHPKSKIFITDGTKDGYKQNYFSTVEVAYSDFGSPGTQNNNMKEVKVTITDSSDNIITVLKTYSANIGEVDYHKGSY